MPPGPQARELVRSFILFAGFLFAIWCTRQVIAHFRGTEAIQTQPRIVDGSGSPLQSVHYWMMDSAVPQDVVRIWLPEYLDHQTQCQKDKFSKALALAMVLDLEEQINRHEGHYHLKEDDDYGGFRIDEFVRENDGTGERWVGRDNLVHYHGVYVDRKNAEDFIGAVIGHQHGAK